MLNLKTAAALLGTVGIQILAASTANAAPFTFAAGGGTYTYNASSGADSNAALGQGASYYNEATQGGGTAQYYTTAVGNPGTVTYTFDAAAGEKFTGLASVTQRFDLYDKGSISGSYSTDNGLSGPIESSTNTAGFPGTGLPGPTPGSNHSYDTNSINVAGASEITITYSLTNDVTPNYIQLFRSDSSSDTAHPFVVTATSAVPEPASLGVLSLGGLAFLARRRRA